MLTLAWPRAALFTNCIASPPLQVRKLARWLSTTEIETALQAGEAAQAAAVAAAPERPEDAPERVQAEVRRLPRKKAKKKARLSPRPSESYGDLAVRQLYAPGGAGDAPLAERLRPDSLRGLSVAIKMHTTVGALLDDVRAVVAIMHGAAWAEHVIDWDAAAAVLPAVCIMRVRAGGAVRLHSRPHMDGTQPPDPLGPDDELCASDAARCMQYLRSRGVCIDSHEPLRDPVICVPNVDSVHDIAARLHTAIGCPIGLMRVVANTDHSASREAVDDICTAIDDLRDRRVPLRSAVAVRGGNAADESRIAAMARLAKLFGIDLLRQQRGGYIIYSSLQATGVPLSSVPKAPRGALPAVRGYAMARHDELLITRRPEGCCAGEAMAFACGDAAVGDVADAIVVEEGFMHRLDKAIAPVWRLQGVPDMPDFHPALSFVDLGKKMQGIFVVQALVLDEHGKKRPHMLVFDAWRRLLFLGAGEVDQEWMAGLLGVQGKDLRGSTLDDRLLKLRVLQLQQVRMLMCRCVDVPADTTYQRKKRKRKQQRTAGP